MIILRAIMQTEYEISSDVYLALDDKSLPKYARRFVNTQPSYDLGNAFQTKFAQIGVAEH